MARLNIKEKDPIRYSIIKEKQDELKKQMIGVPSSMVECPYCRHSVYRIFEGKHSAIQAKCDRCGEEFLFTPVSFGSTK